MIYKITKVRIMNGTNKTIKPDLFINTKRKMEVFRRYFRLKYKADIILFDYESR